MKIRIPLFLCLALVACGSPDASVQDNALTDATPDTLYSDLTRTLLDLERQLIEDPNNADLYAVRATAYLKYDSITNAINDFKRAIAIDSTATRFHVALGEVYFFKIRMEEASEEFKKALELDPESNEARLKLAEIELLLRNYQKSMDLVNEALRMDPHAGKGYFLKGWAYKELGDTTRAISSFRTAAEQDPEYYDAFMQLGLLHAAKDDPLAEDYFNTAITLSPRSVEAYYGKAMYCQTSGKDSIALEVYSKIKEIDPRNATAWYNSGYVYLENLDRAEEAIREFSIAAEKEPRYYLAWYNKGVAHERLEQTDLAGQSFQAALKIKPDHDLSAYGLSRVVDQGYVVKGLGK